MTIVEGKACERHPLSSPHQQVRCLRSLVQRCRQKTPFLYRKEPRNPSANGLMNQQDCAAYQQLGCTGPVLRPLLQAGGHKVAELRRELVGGEHRRRVVHDERQQVPEAQVGRLRVGKAAQRALHDAQPHAPDVRVDAVLPALDALRLQGCNENVFPLFLCLHFRFSSVHNLLLREFL
jgi:hypothetical protein